MKFRSGVILFLLLVPAAAVVIQFPSLYTPPAMKGMLEEVASLEPSEGTVLKDLVYKRRLLRKDLTLEDYSPLNHVNALWPPVLMFHGTADRTVSIRQSEEFDRRLTEAGVPHRFHIVPEGDHGFFNKSREEGRVLEQECLQFLLPLISPEA